MLRRTGTAFLRLTGAAALRNAALRRAALARAAATMRGLALVYHRVRPDGAEPHEVVPTLPLAILREQLELLADIGDIVPIASLSEPPAVPGRVRFAISFDDDEPSHVDHALPLLRSLGLPATFFISGRALHGLGPYWWRCLEILIRDRGLEEACRILDIPARSPTQLAARCEDTDVTDRIRAIAPCDDIAELGRDGIRSLAANGMSIGFHTLHHPVLTTLTPAALSAALERGRAELSAVVGEPLRMLAYPHGLTNRAVADATATTGYAAAFAAGGRPITPSSDRFRLGRWEPGALRGDRFVAAITLRLMRRADPRSV